MNKAFVLFSCLAAASAARAADYYVDCETGDDARTGLTPQNAFKTFARATARLNPGDTLHLTPGRIYRETLRIRRGGTPEKPIVIQGHGATIDGLLPLPDDSWIAKGDGLFLSPNKRCWGAHDPQVTDASGRLISVDPQTHTRYPVAKLAAGQAGWNKEGTWYRSADGAAPKGLKGYLLGEGVNIAGDVSYITVENLTCTHVSNDGFNVHGSCFGLIFRNVVGCDNGDEGLSVHEDVQAVIYNGLFYGNGDGICDICASQTQYFGCTIVSNRLYGVAFCGGSHALYNCRVADNFGHQVSVQESHLKDYHFEKSSPALQGFAYLKDTRIGGGEGPAVRIHSGSSAHIDHCVLAGTDTGVLVRKDGKLHVTRTKWGAFRGEKTVLEPDSTFVEDTVKEVR